METSVDVGCEDGNQMGPGGGIEGQWHCLSRWGGGGGGCQRVLAEARYWATLAQTNSWRVSPGKSLLLRRGNTIDRGSRFAWGGLRVPVYGLVEW